MNEDYSNLIKNFSEILKEKNIDVSTIIPNNSKTHKNCTETNTPLQNQGIQSQIPISDFDINFDDILKIKNILEKNLYKAQQILENSSIQKDYKKEEK